MKKLTTEEFIKRALGVHGDRYDYTDTIYTNKRTKIKITCKKHGVFEQSPLHHLSGSGCKKCYGESVSERCKKPISHFIERAKNVHGDKYHYTGKHTDTHMEIVCKKHGRFMQNIGNHASGHNCPKCAVRVSKFENELAEKFNFEQSNRDLLNGKEIDLVNHERKLGIEINGVYWHRESEKDRNYHLSKTNLTNDKGYQLLHFWDLELMHKKELVYSMVASRLGLSERKIYARKCVIQDIDSKTCNEFLEYNHLQGKCNASIRYGLFYVGELVAVMTFAKPRYNKKYDWELIRFCSQQNTNVVGAASKLFSHFKRLHENQSVISYANKRFSNGNVYIQIGFNLVGHSVPSYSWVKGIQIYSRSQTQKHKLKALLGEYFNESLTEAENMQSNGFYRIWDCGNMIFEFR